MNKNSQLDTQELQLHEMVDIECFGMTDVGKKRESNQDHFVIAELHKHLATEYSSVTFDAPQVFGEPMGKLLLVADGMGGANAGDVASELAVKSTVKYLLNSMHWLYHPTEPEIQQFIEDLKDAACFSHHSVRDAQAHPEQFGMGSTLTVAYIVWPMLYVLHVGDSRCYLRHNEKLGLLTKDQTFAQSLFDLGHLSSEEFGKSPYQHVLTSAIGVDGQPDAAVYQHRLSYGDEILLCSDG
ncbi:MAG: PP2C family serine/threonine-protein phosphatase, partial [Mariniblastus sp.]